MLQVQNHSLSLAFFHLVWSSSLPSGRTPLSCPGSARCSCRPQHIPAHLSRMLSKENAGSSLTSKRSTFLVLCHSVRWRLRPHLGCVHQSRTVYWTKMSHLWMKILLEGDRGCVRVKWLVFAIKQLGNTWTSPAVTHIWKICPLLCFQIKFISWFSFLPSTHHKNTIFSCTNTWITDVNTCNIIFLYISKT